MFIIHDFMNWITKFVIKSLIITENKDKSCPWERESKNYKFDIVLAYTFKQMIIKENVDFETQIRF